MTTNRKATALWHLLANGPDSVELSDLALVLGVSCAKVRMLLAELCDSGLVWVSDG